MLRPLATTNKTAAIALRATASAVPQLMATFAVVLLASGAGASETPRSQRVVSLNPSLTAILVALGAADRLVGVDDWSAQQQAEVSALPKVGGLYSPSLEAVVALQPDLVVLVPSVEQREFRSRLEALGLRVEVFENIRFEQVLENISRLGALVGRSERAAARIAEIRRTRREVGRAVAAREPPRTLIVLQRSPLFVAGGDNFLDEMLSAAGGLNLGREFETSYPRVATEWVVEAAPEVILDLGPDPGEASAFWRRWPSLPAVAGKRIVVLDATEVSLPGPWLDRSLVRLARALHGPGLALELSDPAPPPHAATPAGSR